MRVYNVHIKKGYTHNFVFLLYFDYNIECFNYNIYDIYKDTSHTIIV